MAEAGDILVGAGSAPGLAAASLSGDCLDRLAFVRPEGLRVEQYALKTDALAAGFAPRRLSAPCLRAFEAATQNSIRADRSQHHEARH